MASNDRLEQLKQQVSDMSNQRYQMQVQKEEAKALIANHEQLIEQNEQEMTQLMRSVFEQSELAAAKERERTNARLDTFSQRLRVMNEQLIALNDSLSSPLALEELYTVKRRELEADYEKQKRIFQDRLNRMNKEVELKHRKHEEDILEKIKQGEERIKQIEEQICCREKTVEELDSDIQLKKSEIEELTAKIKKKTFMAAFKENLIDKGIIWVAVGLIGTLLGGIFGWSIFSFFSWIVNCIANAFNNCVSFIQSIFKV